MMDWIYRFTSNLDYPDPVEEIDALCTLDDNEEQAFLLLSSHEAPPMSRASCGDIVGLCTSENGGLTLHGIGVVAGDCVQGATPASVEWIYGHLTGRRFCPLKDLNRQPGDELPETILSIPDKDRFLQGQSYVKRLTLAKRTRRKSAKRVRGKKSNAELTDTATDFTFPSARFIQNSPEFTVVGLDPTAGTWDSKDDGRSEGNAIIHSRVERNRLSSWKRPAEMAFD